MPATALRPGHCLFLGELHSDDDSALRTELSEGGWLVRTVNPPQALRDGDGETFDLLWSDNPASLQSRNLAALMPIPLKACAVRGMPDGNALQFFDIFFCEQPSLTEPLRRLGKTAFFVPPGWDRTARYRVILERLLSYRRETPTPVDWSRISYGYSDITQSEVSGPMVHAWQSEAIPARQRALVQWELRNMYAGKPPKVYQVLSDALRPYLASGTSILEIGCASGYYSEILEYLLNRPLDYHGVDYSRPLIQLAKRMYPDRPFLVADGASLPFADDFFPVAISSCVLMHVPNYREHIQETARIAANIVVAHRSQVCRLRPTRYFRKFAYGVETVELVINEGELLGLFAAVGLTLLEALEIHADPAGDEYTVTYVFEKKISDSTEDETLNGPRKLAIPEILSRETRPSESSGPNPVDVSDKKPNVYTISQFTRFKDGKPHSRGGAEKHFHMLAEACQKAGYPTRQFEVNDPDLPAALDEPDAVFLVDSWMGMLVKRSKRVVSSCISVWAETNLVAYGNPPDEMALKQLEYWSRTDTHVVAQCVLSKIHMEKWARHFGFPVSPLLKVVPLGVDTDVYHPADREAPNSLRDALIIHAAPPGNRKKRPEVFEKMRGRFRIECLDADIGEEPEKYRRGDIFVHVPYSEDNCYSVIEAMATGMVCVFSDCVNPDKEQTVQIENGIGYLRGVPFAAYVKSDASQEEIEAAIVRAWDNRTYLMPRVLAYKHYNLAQWEKGWLDAIDDLLISGRREHVESAPKRTAGVFIQGNAAGVIPVDAQGDGVTSALRAINALVSGSSGPSAPGVPKGISARPISGSPFSIAPNPRTTLSIAWRNRADMIHAKGGDGTVIEETMAGLQALGHRVDLRLEKDPELRDYDVLHLNNISRSQDTLEHLAHAKSQGKPTVLTSLYEDMDRYLKPAMKTDLMFRYLAMKKQVLPLDALAKLRDSFQLDADPLDDPFAKKYGIGDKERQGAILRGVDLILTSGRNESDSIRKVFGSTAPISEMQYGFNRAFQNADPRMFRERHGIKDFAICVGRLEPRKNQWQLIEIFRSLPKLKLVLIGVFSDPSMEPLIKAYAPKNVIFLPRLSQAELASAYAAARLHILPSWYELPGLVSLEAAAAGCRVATTDWGTSRDYFGDYADYLAPDDPMKMKASILSSFESKPRVGLREYVLEKFSWEKTAQQAVEAYRRVLDPAR